MKQIAVGKREGDQNAAVRLDVARLVKTRLLVTANSGGGKSWLLRLLFELLGKSEQLIVLDREGEFVTLREKLDVVIVGPSGEIPTDVRSAGLLARRLMERHVSAVIDMSELRLDLQRRYVRLFLEAFIELPKSLWRPCFLGLDETHLFCPEKGAGEAESRDAVINLATLGRKRGYCPIFATQRISKFHKDAAAELLNKFIGRTTLDVDQKRAADELGMSKDDGRGLRDLSPPGHEGEFFAFGPALIDSGVIKMRVGRVTTTHPEAGQGRTLEPPKPSKAIAAVVAELSDLPQQAEAEAKDLATARQRIAALEAELRHAKSAAPQPKAGHADRASAAEAHRTIAQLRKGLADAMKALQEARSHDIVAGLDRQMIERTITQAVEQITKAADQQLARKDQAFRKWKAEAGSLIERLQKLVSDNGTASAAPADATTRAAPPATSLPTAR